MAATLEEAIGDTQRGVTVAATTPATDLWQNLSEFEAMFAQFNENVETERTVRNWKVPISRILAKVPVGAGNDNSDLAPELVLVVYQATCAAKFAADAGRITPAQAANFLFWWNNSWL